MQKASKPRIVHFAALFNKRGGASAACSESPRAINMRRATWSISWDAVTCKACLAVRAAQKSK